MAQTTLDLSQRKQQVQYNKLTRGGTAPESHQVRPEFLNTFEPSYASSDSFLNQKPNKHASHE